jgi:magnesium-protoporphyrin O-methyltransferase
MNPNKALWEKGDFTLIATLSFELLERGMRKGVVADASGAYVSASKDEAIRRGVTASTEIVQGDLLELGAKLPSADLVTLDRVVCC